MSNQKEKEWFFANMFTMSKKAIYLKAKALGCYQQIVDLIGEPTENEKPVEMVPKPKCKNCNRRKDFDI